MNKYIRFNLALVRALRGKLTQRDIAQATGLSQKTLSALETGASKGIDFATLAKLCDFLRCTPNDLLIVEEEIEDLQPSADSMAKAEEIIARGLKKAMQAPEQTPEEIWAEFELLRKKMQAQAQESEQRGGRKLQSA